MTDASIYLMSSSPVPMLPMKSESRIDFKARGNWFRHLLCISRYEKQLRFRRCCNRCSATSTTCISPILTLAQNLRVELQHGVFVYRRPVPTPCTMFKAYCTSPFCRWTLPRKRLSLDAARHLSSLVISASCLCYMHTNTTQLHSLYQLSTLLVLTACVPPHRSRRRQVP